MKIHHSLTMRADPHLHPLRLSKAVVLLCLFLFAPISHAASRYYDVEVIIFEDANATYLHAEQWDNVVTPINATSSNKKISPPITADKTTTAVEDKSAMIKNIKPYILTKEEKRIAASSHYNVLMYAAWRQPGWDKTQAQAVKLSELKNNAVVKTENSIAGTLKVVLARYLHFSANLDYRRKAMQVVKPEDDNNNINLDENQAISNSNNNADVISQPIPVIQHYPVTAHRRMRSKELHYIDHPLVGMLVQINTSPVVENNQANKTNAPVTVFQHQSAAPVHH